MEIDGKITRVKELIAKREELDAELNELLGGGVREKRSPKCSIVTARVHAPPDRCKPCNEPKSPPLRRAFLIRYPCRPFF